MWTCALAGLGSASVSFLALGLLVINGVSLAPLSAQLPTPRGSLLDVSPGARAARGGGRVRGLGAGINTGHVYPLVCFSLRVGMGGAQHAPSRTLRGVHSWDARPSPHGGTSQALA